MRFRLRGSGERRISGRQFVVGTSRVWCIWLMWFVRATKPAKYCNSCSICLNFSYLISRGPKWVVALLGFRHTGFPLIYRDFSCGVIFQNRVLRDALTNQSWDLQGQSS